MPDYASRRALIGLAGWLALVFVAATIGAAGSIDAGPFYGQLARPHWAPPAWLFGPVWSALYLLIAIAAWLVWQRHGWHRARGALALFVVQLGANALWSWLFFAWRLGGPAFAEIVILWLLIVATLVAFWRLRVRLAAGLMLPYLAWVSFAVVLCHAIWQLNPDALG